MTPVEFCCWLQGYFDLSKDDNATINRRQAKTIQDNLNHSLDPLRNSQTTAIVDSRGLGNSQ